MPWYDQTCPDCGKTMSGFGTLIFCGHCDKARENLDIERKVNGLVAGMDPIFCRLGYTLDQDNNQKMRDRVQDLFERDRSFKWMIDDKMSRLHIDDLDDKTDTFVVDCKITFKRIHYIEDKVMVNGRRGIIESVDVRNYSPYCIKFLDGSVDCCEERELRLC